MGEIDSADVNKLFETIRQKHKKRESKFFTKKPPLLSNRRGNFNVIDLRALVVFNHNEVTSNKKQYSNNAGN